MGAVQPVTVRVRVVAPWSGSEQNSRQAPAPTASVRDPPPYSPTVRARMFDAHAPARR